MARPHEQQIALALVPKFSAFLSVLGSSWIILEVLRDRQKQAMVYHRLLLALSVLDVIISTAWFMSTWPVPSNVVGLFGNMGNETTCNIQGFFIQLKAGNPFYNTFLALYFVLVVKFGWTEHQIRTTIEPYLHIIPICMALGTATASLVLGLYGNANLWCWISGKHSTYRLAFFYVWYWASLVAVTLAMVTVYWTVRQQEAASLRYSVKGGKNTRKVGMQAILYISAYFLTALFATIVRVMQALSHDGFVPFWAVLCMTIFYPSQGLMNFVIYIRPRYLHYRHKNPDWSLIKTITMSLQRAFRVGGGGRAGMTTTSMGDENHHYDDDGDHKLGTPLEESSSNSSLRTNDVVEVPSDDQDDAGNAVGTIDDVEQSVHPYKAQS
jgi:hypothetical protein